MDYEAFINSDKALLIAPAGYGKTYTLARCLQHTEGMSLVLTHTHAGVASIKQKLKDAGIHSSKYSVETITSFAQKYVDSFYIGGEKPQQEDTNNYYPFIIRETASILSNSTIRDILRATYSGMFVDEYQDCSREQHLMLREMMGCFPTRILGDPLQGIFDFNGELVDFDSDLSDFQVFPSLDVPHRWNQVGANDLGEALARIRLKLERGEGIDLNEFKDSIDIVIAPERDLFDPRTEYCGTLNAIRGEESLLVLHPESRNKAPRLKFSQRFKEISSIESIDDTDFYSLARLVDKFDYDDLTLGIKSLSYELFSKTGLNHWFNEKGFKNKKDATSKALVLNLKGLIDTCNGIEDIDGILLEIEKLPKVSCSRRELFKSLLKAIDISVSGGGSVLEGMREQRNNIRRAGRRLEGRHIGTTLLTKGLEFDVVAVLDAHKFKSPKHLYVALTRCRKRLVVFASSSELRPYD
ncbi:MAG: UvrD-helicase domain-containing protein [Candidatus Thiodiazotropha sp.]